MVDVNTFEAQRAAEREQVLDVWKRSQLEVVQALEAVVTKKKTRIGNLRLELQQEKDKAVSMNANWEKRITALKQVNERQNHRVAESVRQIKALEDAQAEYKLALEKNQRDLIAETTSRRRLSALLEKAQKKLMFAQELQKKHTEQYLTLRAEVDEKSLAAPERALALRVEDLERTRKDLLSDLMDSRQQLGEMEAKCQNDLHTVSLRLQEEASSREEKLMVQARDREAVLQQQLKAKVAEVEKLSQANYALISSTRLLELKLRTLEIDKVNEAKDVLEAKLNAALAVAIEETRKARADAALELSTLEKQERASRKKVQLLSERVAFQETLIERLQKSNDVLTQNYSQLEQQFITVQEERDNVEQSAFQKYRSVLKLFEQRIAELEGAPVQKIATE